MKSNNISKLIHCIWRFLCRIYYNNFHKRKVLYYARRFLGKGIYRYDFKGRCFVRQKRLFSRKMLKTVMIGKGGSHPYEYVDFAYGGGKVVFLDEKFAYAIYYDPDYYEWCKEKYIRFIDNFNYPTLHEVGFMEENGLKYQRMSRAFGTEQGDETHDSIVLGRLLQYLTTADICFNGSECRLLQHGDVKRENIIWTNENDFVFIDLDDIGMYPPLNDILHFCMSIGTGIDAVEKVCRMYSEYFNSVCCRMGINAEDNPLDKMFVQNLLFHDRYKNDSYKAIFQNSDLSKYPQTKQLLTRKE